MCQTVSLSSPLVRTVLAAVMTTVVFAPTASAALAPGGCVQFEDLQLGTQYQVPANFSSSGTTITTSAFQWSNGTWYTGGYAEVDDRGESGGTGLDMQVNNITLNFAFGRQVESLRMFFGEYGGNVNLTINGDLRNVGDFDELDGQNVGGVLVEVNVSAGGFGVMILSGTVSSFSVGGQELWIDDICETVEATGCIEFEELPLGEQYEFGQFFVDSGVGMWLGEFYWYPSGTPYTEGYCLVDDGLVSGGTGQDVYPNNANIHFGLDDPLAGISFLYGDLGGNVNLIVNDVLANTGDFKDLHNTTVGGVMVTVEPPGGTAGRVTVTGTIESFAVGGQETWIDHVCGVSVLVFNDGFESGGTGAWSNAVGGP